MRKKNGQIKLGRRERGMSRDTCRDGKHRKIVFGHGLGIGSFLSTVRFNSAQLSSFHVMIGRHFVVGRGAFSMSVIATAVVIQVSEAKLRLAPKRAR
jgi:hypothetical protein